MISPLFNTLLFFNRFNSAALYSAVAAVWPLDDSYQLLLHYSPLLPFWRPVAVERCPSSLLYSSSPIVPRSPVILVIRLLSFSQIFVPRRASMAVYEARSFAASHDGFNLTPLEFTLCSQAEDTFYSLFWNPHVGGFITRGRPTGDNWLLWCFSSITDVFTLQYLPYVYIPNGMYFNWYHFILTMPFILLRSRDVIQMVLWRAAREGRDGSPG